MRTSPREIGRFAAEAERLGAASLWVGDRLLAPAEPTVGYGGTMEIPEAFHSILDPFAVLAVAAAATRTAAIGTNVLNAPWYPPALLARSLTTIDLISGGRLVAGFGTGWSPEEYRAVGIPMNERGARLDECLDALNALWAGSPAAHEGKYWSVPATHVKLGPAQTPRPPIYLGGYSQAADRKDGHARRRVGLPASDTTRYHDAMAMTLRLSDEQTEQLRRKAEVEHRSMQQVALAAIDAYVHQPAPARRQAVPVSELMTLFHDLPPIDAQKFRADVDQIADSEAYFDAYERARQDTEDK